MNETVDWSLGQPMIRPKIYITAITNNPLQTTLQEVSPLQQSLPQVRSSMQSGLQEISCSVMLLGEKFG